MAAVGVVETAIDQIIHVIAMWHGFMTAAGTMAMDVLVNLLRTAHRVLSAHLDDMLFGMSAVRMHKAAILQIVHVIPVADSQMAAVRAVPMGV
jgi:hypothetical protein